MADNLKDLKSITTFLKNYFNKVVLSIKGEVKVSNFPEVQKVEVSNPTESHKTVDIGNLSELQKTVETTTANIVKELKSGTTETKPEKLRDDLLKALGGIKKELTVRPEDKTHEVTTKLDELVNSIKAIDTTTDIQPIVNELQTVIVGLDFFKNVKKFDEVKTRMNEKQLEQLIKAAKSGGGVATSGGGGSASIDNLGKAEDVAHSSGDTGVPMLGVYNLYDDTGIGADTDGDYAMPRFDRRGRLRVSPGSLHLLDNFNVTTGWAAIDTDTTNLATTTNHVLASNALTFDKANTAANNTLAMIEKTITSTNIFNLITGAAFMQTIVLIPDLTNVVNIVIRLGTDSSNYNTWKIDATNAVAGKFEAFRSLIADSEGSTGNGWLITAVTYIAVGLEFSTETNTLAGIVFDGLNMTAGQVNSSDTTSDITTQLNTANINIHKVGGSSTDKGGGNVSNGSQRVVEADNSTLNTAVAAVQTAVEGTLTTQDVQGSSAGTSTGITVGTGTTTVLASNASRKQAIIVNDSDEVVYLKYGATAVANSGIRLNASGGSIIETIYTGVINGICASGSKVITVTEI